MSGILRLLGFVARAALVAQAARLTARMLSEDQPPGPAPAPDEASSMKRLGRMVQDPVCGTYLAEKNVVHRLPSPDGELVFCSDACRDEFQRASRG